MYWLKITRGDGWGRYYSLNPGVTLIGRDPDCKVRIDSRKVSKRHAQIEVADGIARILDLRSLNDTKVGERLAHEPITLVDGDVIRVGEFEFQFVRDEFQFLDTQDASTSGVGRRSWTDAPEKLTAVLQIGFEMGGAIGLERVLDRALDSLLRIFPSAERGLILVEEGDQIRALADKPRKPHGPAPILSRTIFNEVVGRDVGLLCADARADSQFAQAASVITSSLRSMICSPLHTSKGLSAGVIQISTTDDDAGRFNGVDLGLLIAVAGPIGLAIENAGLVEAEIRRRSEESLRLAHEREARGVQRTLIPDRRPSPPGYDFWDHYEPARFVGGDYFDYIRLGGDQEGPERWVLAQGDVSGKGMAAALHMARLQSQVRLLFRDSDDPVRVIESLDRHLCEAGQADRFISFLLIVLDVGRHELTILNAGHNPPLLRHPDGRVVPIEDVSDGILLGVDSDWPRAAFRVAIEPGQAVVVCTDGFPDAVSPDGVQFGPGRLSEAVGRSKGTARQLGESIVGAVKDHSAGISQFDDMTMLCFTRESLDPRDELAG